MKVGDRFDVWEILHGNPFAKISGTFVGQQKVSEEHPGSLIAIPTIYGKQFHFPTELKKIGTLIITKVK